MKIPDADISALVVHYRTKDLIRDSVLAFRRFYPGMALLIVDNSSFDDSSRWIFDFAESDGNTVAVFNNFNLHHGPSMHRGVLYLSAHRYIYMFDSDLNLFRAGLIEAMLSAALARPDFYGVGNCEGAKGVQNYLHPRCMLLNRARYFDFPPIKHDGGPMCDAMQKIHALGRTDLLVEFDCFAYARHVRQGTRRRHGSGNGTKREK